MFPFLHVFSVFFLCFFIPGPIFLFVLSYRFSNLVPEMINTMIVGFFEIIIFRVVRLINETK